MALILLKNLLRVWTSSSEEGDNEAGRFSPFTEALISKAAVDVSTLQESLRQLFLQTLFSCLISCWDYLQITRVGGLMLSPLLAQDMPANPSVSYSRNGQLSF